VPETMSINLNTFLQQDGEWIGDGKKSREKWRGEGESWRRDGRGRVWGPKRGASEETLVGVFKQLRTLKIEGT